MFVTLEGASNFRDFGGQVTPSGARVRPGVLYRSNSLAGLTDSDRECLLALGIRRVYDLREPQETASAPTIFSGVLLITSGEHPEMLAWRQKLSDYPQTPQGIGNFLVDLYASLPFIFASDIAAVMRDLAASTTPCVLHCSAGKDRTGVAAAILLDVLGVSRQDIFAEYRLTAGRLGLAEHQRRAFAGADPGSATSLGSLDAQSFATMLSVDDSFLQSAFDAVARRHVSVGNYLQASTDLDSQTLLSFQESLLERP